MSANPVIAAPSAASRHQRAEAVRGLLHESANQIIDDQVNLQFFGNEFGTLATQHVEVQDGFELMNVQFHCPALPGSHRARRRWSSTTTIFWSRAPSPSISRRASR